MFGTTAYYKNLTTTMTEQAKTTTWKIRPSRLRLHGCRRCWNPFLRLLLFLDSSRHVHATFGCAVWRALVFSVGEVFPTGKRLINMYFCWWFLVYESILTNYPLKKGCYPFAVLVWTVKIRCFGATKKEWKTCFSPNTRPFARRSFKNTGTDLYIYIYMCIQMYTDTFKILATTQNHQIQRSLEPPYHQPDFSAKRDWLPDISWLAFVFCNHFTWDVVSDLFFIGNWGLLAKTIFSRFLAFGYKRIKSYMLNICWFWRNLWQQVQMCQNITSELTSMTIFTALLSSR